MTEEKKPSSAKTAEGAVEVPEKFKKLVDEIEKMNVMDLAELVKVLEEKFGVSAMMVPQGGISANASTGEAPKEEKTSFNIELKASGDQKINVIKIVREVTGLGLKEAKNIVDAAPKIIKENAKKEEAEEIKKKLEAAGASVELK